MFVLIYKYCHYIKNVRERLNNCAIDHFCPRRSPGRHPSPRFQRPRTFDAFLLGRRTTQSPYRCRNTPSAANTRDCVTPCTADAREVRARASMRSRQVSPCMKTARCSRRGHTAPGYGRARSSLLLRGFQITAVSARLSPPYTPRAPGCRSPCRCRSPSSLQTAPREESSGAG